MNPENLTWRLLTAEELTNVYLNEMRRDFPAGELKPLSMILNSEAAGTAHTWGVYEDDALVAYLLMVRPVGCEVSQLDYFAVLPQYRAGGIGAAVLAASAAGVLTGCDGGGSEIPSATIGLGEFEVTMTGNMTITGDEVVGNENANGYLCKPNVRIRYNGAASEIKYNFAGVFVAKIDKTALELTNGKEEISSKLTKTYVPQFRAKASGYGSFKQGVPFKLYVTLQGKTAEFALTSDGKVTVSAVDKV